MRNKQKFGDHLKVIWVAVFVTFIIILTVMRIFSFLKSPKEAEFKTFSEISGFTFEYPVFKGWEPEKPRITQDDKTKDIIAVIPLNNPTKINFEMVPSIRIAKVASEIPTESISTIMLKNKNNALYSFYEDSKNGNHVIFYTSGYQINIYPFLRNGDGYSGKVLMDKIIETFKFVECTSESIEAKKLQSFVKIDVPSISFQDGLISKGAEKIIDYLKQEKENPDDFFAKVQVGEKSGLMGFLLTFHLSHKDDFKSENCNKIGNPSGKSRDIVYDTNQEKIIKSLFWR